MIESLKIQEHLTKWSNFYKPRLDDFTYKHLEAFWHQHMTEKPTGVKLVEVAEAALFLKVNSIKLL